MKLALFTDTLEDVNGVARFIRDLGEQARKCSEQLIIHTSVARPNLSDPPFDRKNFDPFFSSAMPYYPQLQVALPPPWPMLQWAEQQRFDAIHVSTPGPVGLCGLLIARWLGLPLAMTYHTDFPAYAQRLTRSGVITGGTTVVMKWFYRAAQLVFSRSKEYQDILVDLGIQRDNQRTIPPAINLQRFNPTYRDERVWEQFGVRQPRRLLYIGRVSIEKNLPVLTEAFKIVARQRNDVFLMVIGDGPYRAVMADELRGLPAVLPGLHSDQTLAQLYGASDLFVFPSLTDTLGQVVMEAQACGLPALVSDQGGPQSIVRDGVSGRVVRSNDPQVWAAAISAMLDDPRLPEMRRSAAEHLATFSFERTFRCFWQEHLDLVNRFKSRPALLTRSRELFRFGRIQ